MIAVYGGEGACQLEACTEPAWVIDFTRIAAQCRKAVDGGIGVDTVKMKKILQDARNMFICYKFSTGSS